MNFKLIKKIAVLSLLLLPVLFAFIFINRFYVNVITMDEWAMVRFVLKYLDHSLTFNDLIMPHNEHIIFFPKLIMIPLAAMTHWNSFFEPYLAVLFLCICLFFIILYLKKRYNYSNALIIAIPVSFLLFHFKQHENFLFAFQLAYVMPLPFAIASFFWFDKYCNNSDKTKYLIASIIASIIAFFSNGTGLTVLPIIVFLLVFSDINRRNKITSVIISIIILLILIIFWTTINKMNSTVPNVKIKTIFDNFQHIWNFMVTLTGGVYKNRNISYYYGLVLLSYASLTIFINVYYKKINANIFPLSILFFSLSVIIIISISRWEWQMIHSRYLSHQIFIIISLYLMSINFLIEKKHHGRIISLNKIFSLMILVSVFILIPLTYYRGYLESKTTYAYKNLAKYVTQNFDIAPPEYIYHTNGFAFNWFAEYAPKLKNRHMNVFNSTEMKTFSTDNFISVSIPFGLAPANVSINTTTLTIRGSWKIEECDSYTSPAFVAVDNKSFQAIYFKPGRKISDVYAGFFGFIPLKDIPEGIKHRIKLKIISMKKNIIYESSELLIMNDSDLHKK